MQQTSTGISDMTPLCEKGDPQGFVQEIEIWPYYQMVCAQIRICPRKWGIKFSGILRYKQIT